MQSITKSKLQWEIKSPSEVVNVAAPQVMNSLEDDEVIGGIL
jgi:hypothetical protein